MKFTLYILLFFISAESSTQKTLTIKEESAANISETKSVYIKCANCKTVNDSNGIAFQNNALSHSNEIVYGWTVEVPQHHDILLLFSWPSDENWLNGTSLCESCKPYFEIIFGYSSSESTFKIEKFYNIRQLTYLSVPSHKAEIRFFSGAQCNDSEKLENAGFSISFEAIPLEQTWSIYTLLSVFVPAGFIVIGVGYFCGIMKKKEDCNHNDLTLPIPIYVDMENPPCDVKKCEAKENVKGRGLRLRTQNSCGLEEPKVITVISSLAESETLACPQDLITPDSSDLFPAIMEETKKHLFKKKRALPKVNLLNRYPRSVASTPRYASFHDETYHIKRLSKSDIPHAEKRKPCHESDTKIFNFNVVPDKEGPDAQLELETSVFFHSSSASSPDSLPNKSILELPFVSPK